MRKLTPIVVLAAVGVMAGLRAWVCDDAFITFRVVEQYLAGAGPVLNIGERVQVFTHPLWMMALAAWAGVGFPLVPGAMWLSLGIFGAGLAALGAAFRDKPLALCVAGVLMFCSRTLADFATSGLETPLTFALFAGALLALRSGTPRTAVVLLALLPLNRLDLLPWALPFAWVAAGPGLRARAGASVAIGVPAALWALFSTIYYGAALPNTALAKLSGDWSGRIDQGLSFVVGSLVMDPGSLALFIAGIAIAVMALRNAARTRDREIAAAGALSAAFAVAYVLWSGGDFMLGRFMLPALWALLAVMLAGFPEARKEGLEIRARRAGAATLALLAVLHLASGQSTANLWLDLTPESALRVAGFEGAIDERRYYIPWMGLHSRASPAVLVEPMAAASTGQPMIVGPLGRMGYYGRRDQPMIDIWALVDPFLARLAPLPHGRPGHGYRPFPPDFPRWRESDHAFGDARLDAIASDLRLVHRSADLWSAERAAAIARLAGSGTISHGDLAAERDADSVRATVKPAWLFRLWPDARRFVVGLDLADGTVLGRQCEKLPAPANSQDPPGIEVAAGETLTLRCPATRIGDSLVVRVGAPRAIEGRERVVYDEGIALLRPTLWWLPRVPDCVAQGWRERPRAAVVVALLLLAAAALLGWPRRDTLPTGRSE